jgi:hypothetical protein
MVGAKCNALQRAKSKPPNWGKPVRGLLQPRRCRALATVVLLWLLRRHYF